MSRAMREKPTLETNFLRLPIETFNQIPKIRDICRTGEKTLRSRRARRGAKTLECPHSSVFDYVDGAKQ